MKLPPAAPAQLNEEIFTKTQKRRRAKKRKRQSIVALLQAQLDAASATLAGAFAATNQIHENFSVETAVPSASEAPAPTNKICLNSH